MAESTEYSGTTATHSNVLPFPPPESTVSQGPRKAFCIPCALRSREFRERAPASSRTPLDAGDCRRAWIEGRGYELFHHPASKVVCIRCGMKVHTAYIPEEPSIA